LIRTTSYWARCMIGNGGFQNYQVQTISDGGIGFFHPPRDRSKVFGWRTNLFIDEALNDYYYYYYFKKKALPLQDLCNHSQTVKELNFGTHKQQKAPASIATTLEPAFSVLSFLKESLPINHCKLFNGPRPGSLSPTHNGFWGYNRYFPLQFIAHGTMRFSLGIFFGTFFPTQATEFVSFFAMFHLIFAFTTMKAVGSCGFVRTLGQRTRASS
jgi:hypothetical protein